VVDFHVESTNSIARNRWLLALWNIRSAFENGSVQARCNLAAYFVHFISPTDRSLVSGQLEEHNMELNELPPHVPAHSALRLSCLLSL
jgi:hypothetical protein